MPSTTVRLTVYFDGQFWIALAEREDDGRFSVARHVFGPEPSLQQIAGLVSGRDWSGLEFLTTDAGAPERRIAANPKRRQREAARESRAIAPSTTSQDALKAAIETQKHESTATSGERRAAEAEARWEHHVAKRKDKKRGH